jgi:hypothetical protein
VKAVEVVNNHFHRLFLHALKHPSKDAAALPLEGATDAGEF